MKNYFTNPDKSRKLRLLFYDGMLVSAVLVLSYALRVVFYERASLLTLPDRIPWLVAPAAVLHLLAFFVFGLYDIQSFRNRKLLFINLFLAILSATLLIALLSFALPRDRIGRVLTGTQFVLMNIAMFAWRFIYARKFSGNGNRSVIFIGWNALVAKAAGALRFSDLGYALTGVVIPPPEQAPKELGNPIPVFGCLEEALCRTGAQTIVVTKDPRHMEAFKSRLLDLRFKNTEIFTGPSFYQRALGKVPVSEISESWLLYGSREGLFQPFLYAKVKRLFDFFFSVLVFITTWPMFLITALLIKLDSKGPVFFRQERLGLDERPFMLFKFRTMVDNAEKETGPCWACANDSRFTRVGKFLRKTRMDEFPQFINVLKGDMSLVGPRPIRRHFADIFTEKFPFYRLRFKVKPGITGWAQVNMDYVNTEEDQYDKLEYEVYYLYHQSVFLDFFIILKTVQSMLKMRGN